MKHSSNRLLGNYIYSAFDLTLINFDRILSTMRSRISLRLQNCDCGVGFITSGRCSFKAKKARSIRIGKHVTLNGYWRSNRVGLTNPVILQTFGEGSIEIGDYSGASAAIISAKTAIKIGSYVKIGGNVRIFDHDFHSLDMKHRRHLDDEKYAKTAPVIIEDDVFIGTNSIILRGSHIGSGAVLGAGTVLSGKVPPGQTWVGNPARPARSSCQL